MSSDSNHAFVIQNFVIENILKSKYKVKQNDANKAHIMLRRFKYPGVYTQDIKPCLKYAVMNDLHFLDAAQYAKPSQADELHMDSEDYLKLAQAMKEKVMELI